MEATFCTLLWETMCLYGVEICWKKPQNGLVQWKTTWLIWTLIFKCIMLTFSNLVMATHGSLGHFWLHEPWRSHVLLRLFMVSRLTRLSGFGIWYHLALAASVLFFCFFFWTTENTGRVNYQKGILKTRRASYEHFPGSVRYSACYISEFLTCRYLAAVQVESV